MKKSRWGLGQRVCTQVVHKECCTEGNKSSLDLHQLGIDFSESMVPTKLKRCRGEASGAQAEVTVPRWVCPTIVLLPWMTGLW